MARFEFRREGRVWLEDTTVNPSQYYLLHTTREVTFNQTFQQTGVERRTLHDRTKFVEGSSITRANPANFSFTLYMIDGELGFKHQHKPLNFLLDTNSTTEGIDSFNLYFVYSDYSPEAYYKLEKCVFTSGSFNIPRNGLMTVNLSGTASKLDRREASFSTTELGNQSGTYLSDYSLNPVFAVSKQFIVEFKPSLSYEEQDRILGASIEVQNDIDWTPNSTLQESLGVSDESNTIFPGNYVLTRKSVGGSIQQYTDTEVLNQGGSENYIQVWRNMDIRISAGLASNNIQLVATFPDSRFTTRTNFGEVFTQNYDFRAIEDTSTFVYQ